MSERLTTKVLFSPERDIDPDLLREGAAVIGSLVRTAGMTAEVAAAVVAERILDIQFGGGHPETADGTPFALPTLASIYEGMQQQRALVAAGQREA